MGDIVNWSYLIAGMALAKIGFASQGIALPEIYVSDARPIHVRCSKDLGHESRVIEVYPVEKVYSELRNLSGNDCNKCHELLEQRTEVHHIHINGKYYAVPSASDCLSCHSEYRVKINKK